MSVKTDQGHWYQNSEILYLIFCVGIMGAILTAVFYPYKNTPAPPRTYTAQTIVLNDGTTHTCHSVEYDSGTKGWQCLDGKDDQIGWYPIASVARIERHTYTVHTMPATPTPRST